MLAQHVCAQSLREEAEPTFRSANFDDELTGPGARGLDDELSVERRQKTVLDARSVRAHLAGVRRARHQQNERTSYTPNRRSSAIS